MAPTDVTKVTPKAQRIKNRSSPASAIKKNISTTKKRIDRIPLKMSNTVVEKTRPRTSTVPKVNTPKPKESSTSASVPPSSAKKSTWKRRPKPAHSGVPVPEKMKALMQKQLKDLDSNL